MKTLLKIRENFEKFRNLQFFKNEGKNFWKNFEITLNFKKNDLVLKETDNFLIFFRKSCLKKTRKVGQK